MLLPNQRAKLIGIFENFRSAYVGSQLLEECVHDPEPDGITQGTLMQCLVTSLVEGDEAPCLALVRGMCDRNVPFLILSHEIAFLRDALIRSAVAERDLECVTSSVAFFDALEDQLARLYLERYLSLLAQRTHNRLQHIASLSEKNLLSHFESHLRWMGRLVDAVQRCDVAAMPEMDHERCDFGLWLHSDGRSLIRDTSHYRRVVEVHHTMHRVVDEIKTELQASKPHCLPIYALIKKAENLSLDLGNEIAMLNCMIIMSVYNKDPMTGLLTRRTLDRILINQLEISRATDTPFCLLMCDLDHFKRLNDDHGHVVGDQALQHFVRLTRDSIRQADLMFRYGGEEFLIVLPATTYEQGRQLAEKLLARLNAEVFDAGGATIRVQASFGLLEGNGNKVSFIDQALVHELIKECDQRLYIAKHRGRNQVA
jgi:diguanylate cyclase (GGDEF)-like protein